MNYLPLFQFLLERPAHVGHCWKKQKKSATSPEMTRIFRQKFRPASPACKTETDVPLNTAKTLCISHVQQTLRKLRGDTILCCVQSVPNGNTQKGTPALPQLRPSHKFTGTYSGQQFCSTCFSQTHLSCLAVFPVISTQACDSFYCFQPVRLFTTSHKYLELLLYFFSPILINRVLCDTTCQAVDPQYLKNRKYVNNY